MEIRILEQTEISIPIIMCQCRLESGTLRYLRCQGKNSKEKRGHEYSNSPEVNSCLCHEASSISTVALYTC